MMGSRWTHDTRNKAESNRAATVKERMLSSTISIRSFTVAALLACGSYEALGEFLERS
jgi:hypothetical protein